MLRSTQADRALLLVLGVLLFIAALILLSPTGDPSYSCNRPPAWLLVHPAKTEPAGFRHDFFDDGYQCNRDARGRGLMAGLVVLPGLLGYAGYVAWRRRSMGRSAAK